MDSPKKKLPPFIFPFLFFLLNFVLKFFYLESRDIAGDEPFSIFYAQKDLSGIIEMLRTENNPALHFFLLHGWIKLFGISAFSVRFPSLLFSSLTCVVLFKTGERFFNWKTGLVAGLIFSLSTMHIYFSHEARAYPLFCLLASLSLFFYLAIIQSPDEKKNYVLLFLSNIFLIYCHYFGFFILFVELFSLLLVRDAFKMFKKLSLVFVSLFIFYLPNLAIVTKRFLYSSQHEMWVAKPKPGQLYGFLNLFINNRYNMMVLIFVFLLFGILLSNQHKLVDRLKSIGATAFTKVILCWFLIPYLTMFIVSFKLPMFTERYILYTTIPFYLLIGVLMNYFIEKELFKNIAIILFISSLIFTVDLNPDNNRRLKEAVEKTRLLKKKNSVVLLAPDYADLGFTYYYNINYFKDYNNTRNLLNREHIYPVSSREDVGKILLGKNDDVIFLQAGSEFIDPENSIFKNLAPQYRHLEQSSAYQIYLINHFYN